MVDRKPALWKRNYLIDKRFQLKYTWLIIGVSAIIYGIFGYELYQKELANTRILQIQNLDLQGLVASSDLNIIYYLLGFFLLQVVSLFVLGIMITHRVAGPVHRVQIYLEEIAASGELKDLDPVRNRDEFKEFFDSLSQLISKQKAKNNGIRNELRVLQDALKAGDVDRARSSSEAISKLI